VNSPRDLVIGGHGRETVNSALLQLVGSTAHKVLGVLDDNPGPEAIKLVEELGLEILGTRFWLQSNDSLYTFGIGSPDIRKTLDLELRAWGREAWSVVHPSASIGESNRFGEGVVIAPGAVVTTNVELGRHVHLNVNASVSHDSTIGSYTTISPGAVICGSCVIEEEVYIGANACVLQGITVGRGAVVGAGACVVSDVAPGQTVIGVPARPMHSS
jgi:sugar O-acyltransferase (sialic acid O-acetyltransferase NeuD family)